MKLRVAMGVVAVCFAGCGASDDSANDGSGTGSGTGPGTGMADTGVDDGNCGMHVLAAMDEDCEGIGSAQDVFGPAFGERTDELGWAPDSGEQVSHAPAEGTTPITLELRYDGGELRCFHYCDPCPGLPCGAADQPPRIEGDMLFDIASDDGSLAETVGVVATGGEFGPTTSFGGPIAPAALQGTLVVELVSTDFQDLAVNVSGTLGADVVSGAVNATAHHVDPTGPSVVQPIGSWPPL